MLQLHPSCLAVSTYWKNISWLLCHPLKNILVDHEMSFVWRIWHKSKTFFINNDLSLAFIIFEKIFTCTHFQSIFTSIIAISNSRKVDHFTLCCHAEKSLPKVFCTSLVDNGVSSCEELLKNKVLTYCIWVLGVLAFVGNLVVILWRIIRKDINRVNSFLLVSNRCKSIKHSLDLTFLRFA